MKYSADALTLSGTLCHLYSIYNSGAATNVVIRLNTIDNVSRTGIGSPFAGGNLMGIYASAGTNRITSQNTISNLTIGGSGYYGKLYGILHESTSSAISADSNQINNLKITKSDDAEVLSGITINSSTVTNETYNFNTINGLNSIGYGPMVGISCSASGSTTPPREMSYNTVSGLSSAGSSLIGISNVAGNVKVFKNKVYDLHNKLSGTNPMTYGIQQADVKTNGYAYIYNNYVSDLRTTSSSLADGVRGIYIFYNTAVSSTIGVYYNTVYLNASSTGANFGSAGVYHFYNANAANAALDMRNNIIVNLSTSNGTGKTSAFRRSAAIDLNNFKTTSNNNCFYAGTPSASNLIYFDGTNSDQTIDDYKTRVGPTRESGSVSVIPDFVNTTTTPYDLHIKTVNTSLRGLPITTPLSITDDYDGNPRSGTAPNMGAHEFDYTLPVTLASFTASVNGRNARLNWVTAEEENNAGFFVERIKNEELIINNWQNIGFVNGKGNTSNPTTYTFEDRNLESGKYKYRLKQTDYNGNFEYFELVGEVEVGVPAKFELSQNYPNPFNPVTKIDFALPVDSKVSMMIYDVTGREIAKIVNSEFRKAGYHTVQFNGAGFSSGVYFYSIKTDKNVMTKKMLLVK